MLKYSCNNARLANWVLRQVSDQPGFLFPKRKGWRVNLKVHYTSQQESPCWVISVYNGSECLIFVPVNGLIQKSDLKGISGKKSIQKILEETGHQISARQLIYITSAKYEESTAKLLKQLGNHYNLMVLDYERMSFVKGNFQNPRLEYRLSSQEFDPDLIPSFLLEDQQLANDELSNSLFYQKLFFELNSCWLSGERTIRIRDLLKSLIPYWRQYRKKDQQSLVGQITESLESVFQLYFTDYFTIKQSNPKGSEQNEATIVFPGIPVNRKELNGFQRKQEQALAYLRDVGTQISIDSLALP